jgi:hypothetical protein
MLTVYIFECSDETQFECFERNLFGTKANWPKDIRAGDLCFLYNFFGQQKLIYGVYKAKGNARHNIVAEAWGGAFPHQVEVELCSQERIAVPKGRITKIVTNPATLRVYNKLVGDKAQELLQYFAGGYSRQHEAGIAMDNLEQDFRRKYPKEFHCSDGHDVRSRAEVMIDEWLASHKVYHDYERLSNIPENLVPDFTIYDVNQHPVFVEFWGMLDNPDYQQRRLRKCEIYHRHRCSLIELYDDDIRNLDFSLRSKLKAYNVAVV